MAINQTGRDEKARAVNLQRVAGQRAIRAIADGGNFAAAHEQRSVFENALGAGSPDGGVADKHRRRIGKHAAAFQRRMRHALLQFFLLRKFLFLVLLLLFGGGLFVLRLFFVVVLGRGFVFGLRVVFGFLFLVFIFVLDIDAIIAAINPNRINLGVGIKIAFAINDR